LLRGVKILPEILEKRTRTSKTYYLGNGKFALDSSTGKVHHWKNNQWEDINNEIVSGGMDGDGYTFTILQNTFNAGMVVEYARMGEYIQLMGGNLEWSNDLDQLSLIEIPQAATGVVTNEPRQLLPNVDSYTGKVKFTGAYGANRDWEWVCGVGTLIKILTIQSLADLPTPPQYIIDGGNPYLKLNAIFDLSSGVNVFIDEEEWDKKKKEQTFNNIEFRNNDGELLWTFTAQKYWDSPGNLLTREGESIKTVRRAGQGLIIEVRVPYSWLQNATYPVFIDASPIDDQTDTGTDDGYSYGSTFNNTTDHIYVGYPGADIDYFALFGSISGLGGVDIGANSYISLNEGNSLGTPLTKIWVSVEEAPAAPTTAAEHQAKTRSTAGVVWVATDMVAADDGVWVNSPSIEAPLQELIDAPNSFNPSAILILHDNDGSTNNNYIACHSQNVAPNTLGPKIHIEWTEAGATAQAVGDGTITPAGALGTIGIFKQGIGGGSVTPAGALGAIAIFKQAIGSGTLTPTGALGTKTLFKRAVGDGTITPTGALSKVSSAISTGLKHIIKLILFHY